ncbi:unnamed protein product [Bursaphelenchus xylophilus]|uniref:(pine wood nematode) hypothetical protein n=1 Tax=Bursaphelenchus xylophilus TaxID=6326 RepID=A0A1I7RHV1_BURXY|nr:unnamed protein product [Bursaphelenchus xylophilus]CAG9115355.1 unnamed protein product [Bursaphelenchus xylophilus]
MSPRSVTLWQFLLDLLADERYGQVVQWVNKERAEFKLIHPEAVARLWGLRKDKKKMNYDKLSRALRTYYKKNIMVKVKGKEFVYRFVLNSKMSFGGDSVEESSEGSPSVANSSTSSSNNSSLDNSALSSNCRSFSIDKITSDEGTSLAGPSSASKSSSPLVDTPKRRPFQRNGNEVKSEHSQNGTPALQLPQQSAVPLLNQGLVEKFMLLQAMTAYNLHNFKTSGSNC